MNAAPPWLWGLLVGLLFLSGFFSSSETAFFSLAQEERAKSSKVLFHWFSPRSSVPSSTVFMRS